MTTKENAPGIAKLEMFKTDTLEISSKQLVGSDNQPMIGMLGERL